MTTAKKTATKTVTKKTTVKKTATKTAAKATEKKTTAKASVKKAEKKTVVKKTAKTTKKVSSQKTYSEAVQAAAKILFELRAQKLQLIDLRGISETSDFMLLATCESEAWTPIGKANRFRQMGGVKAMLHIESGQVEKNRKFKMGTAEIFEQAFGSLRI